MVQLARLAQKAATNIILYRFGLQPKSRLD
jgi:hypothetical protein